MGSRLDDRQPPHTLLRTIDPIESKAKIGDVEDTDGIAVINCPMGPNFPKGLSIMQDASNDRKNQNFKMYRWEDISRKDRTGNELLIDTTWNPRTPVKREPSSKWKHFTPSPVLERAGVRVCDLFGVQALACLRFERQTRKS